VAGDDAVLEIHRDPDDVGARSRALRPEQFDQRRGGHGLAGVVGREAVDEEIEYGALPLEGHAGTDERSVVGPQLRELIPVLVVEEDRIASDLIADLLDRDESFERVHRCPPTAPAGPAAAARSRARSPSCRTGSGETTRAGRCRRSRYGGRD